MAWLQDSQSPWPLAGWSVPPADLGTMWSAMVVDRDTGDVLLTACLPGVAGDQAAAAILETQHLIHRGRWQAVDPGNAEIPGVV